MEGNKISLSKITKGNVFIVDEFNFVYYKNNYKEGKPHISWKCSKKDCQARIKTTPQYELIGEVKVDDHRHFANKALKRKVEEIENNTIEQMATVPGVQLKQVLSEISTNVEVNQNLCHIYK